MRPLLIAILLLFTTTAFAQGAVPSGTILPLKLNSPLNSRKSRAGQKITAVVAQDVPLSSGSRIRAGSKLSGHIISVSPVNGNAGARISFQFDTLHTAGRSVSITTNLRAMASMMDVYDAQLPDSGPDRGTSENSWVTEQIGGETNYHGGWPVTHGAEVVGTSLPSGGVLVRVSAQGGSECRGEIDDNHELQAMWVFASDACGTYGLEDLVIAHAGRTDPIGRIVLTSKQKEIHVRSGSRLLLRVISGGN